MTSVLWSNHDRPRDRTRAGLVAVAGLLQSCARAAAVRGRHAVPGRRRPGCRRKAGPVVDADRSAAEPHAPGAGWRARPDDAFQRRRRWRPGAATTAARACVPTTTRTTTPRSFAIPRGTTSRSFATPIRKPNRRRGNPRRGSPPRAPSSPRSRSRRPLSELRSRRPRNPPSKPAKKPAKKTARRRVKKPRPALSRSATAAGGPPPALRRSSWAARPTGWGRRRRSRTPSPRRS